MNWSPSANSDYTLLTVKDAAQTNPIDVVRMSPPIRPAPPLDLRHHNPG